MSGDARRAFLAGLIDHAALFPPASLSVPQATRLHLEHRSGLFAWILGRFLCPASKLDELAGAIRGDGEPWRVSVVVDGASADISRLADDLDAAAMFAKQTEGDASVELLEVRLPARDPGSAVAEISAAVRDAALPKAVAPFLEIPPEADLDEALDAIAGERSRSDEGAPGAKLRCGGPDPAAAPTPARVAGFVDGCRSRGIPFKATAGLHHPFRHDVEGGKEHGFVNLVGAAVLARAEGLPVDQLAHVVADEDREAFSLDAEVFRWREHTADAAAIAAARRELFVSYGSCSFSEPTDDLVALGLLSA